MANNVTGIREVQELLSQVDKVASKTLTTAAKDGAKLSLNYAKNQAPVDTGKLKKSIRLRAEKRKVGKRVYRIMFIGDGLVKYSRDGKRAFYPAAQEYGWTDKNGKKHPGKRFLRDSIDTQRSQINDTILQSLYNGLREVIR